MAALLYAAVLLLTQLPSSLGVGPSPRAVSPPPRAVSPPPLAVRSPPLAVRPPPRVGTPLIGNFPPGNPVKLMNAKDKKLVKQFINESDGDLKVPLVACDDLLFYCFPNGRIKYIYLAGKQLQGSIPPVLGQLTTLEGLFLQNNLYNGTIPSSFAKLTNLTYLYLTANRMYGKIPTFLGNMKKLKDVALAYNLFSGIPPKFTNVANNTGLLQLTGNFFSSVSLLTSGNTTVPTCLNIGLNCLFGVGLPTGCPSYKQRRTYECKDFCDTTQPGGVCGGHGDCNYKPAPEIGAYCICNKGYKLPAISNSTCVPI